MKTESKQHRKMIQDACGKVIDHTLMGSLPVGKVPGGCIQGAGWSMGNQFIITNQAGVQFIPNCIASSWTSTLLWILLDDCVRWQAAIASEGIVVKIHFDANK